MLTDTLKQAYRRSWWALVIRGALALALGIFILARPSESVAVFALVIAIWALVAGITEIVHSIELKPLLSSWWALLLSGLVSAAFGVAALYYYPGLSLAFAITWVSFWLALTGILGIYLGVQLKKSGLPWGWVLAFGVVSLLASIFCWLSPPATLGAIMGLIAGFAIVSGIFLLAGAFRIKSFEHDVTQSVRQPKPA
jgi:uncharacterized membrane protein HdeD (DUF308 family)